MQKLFFGIQMKWWRVIAFAAVTGVVTGIIMQIHALDGTSIQNIGISYEAWILFAVILCMNCEKAWEASLKTFVFFLISQPLVYLTMWPEYHCFPWHYYRFWGIMTVLTLPGGFICWQVKRKNLPGALVLSVACAGLGALAAEYTVQMLRSGAFPLGLLAIVFCIAQVAVYIKVLVPRKWHRILVTAIACAAAAAVTWIGMTADLSSSNYPLEGCRECTVADEKIVSACVADDGDLDIVAHRRGTTEAQCLMEDGSTITISITVKDNGSIVVKVPE